MSYSQTRDYSSFMSVVGTTSEHIIEGENLIIATMPEITTRLIKVVSEPSNGYSLYYGTAFNGSNSVKVYSFDKNNICQSYSQILDLKEYQEELSDIKKSFKSVSQGKYDHPTLNLQVICDFNPSDTFASITYKHKSK